jgi:hypothetical protein
MDHPFADKLTLDYASRRRRRTLAEIVDVELWAAVGVVVALLAADVACIIIILLPG